MTATGSASRTPSDSGWPPQPPSTALDATEAPTYRWFPDGRLNTCFNALDRHVHAGRGDSTALVYDSAVTGEVRRYSYQQLLDQVSRFAGGLSERGVRPGDRVVIYMPMIPEAVVAMLACARIGVIHSVVFGGFAAAELTARIDDAKPTALLTASGGLEPTRSIDYLTLVRRAIADAVHPPRTVVVKHRAGCRPCRIRTGWTGTLLRLRNPLRRPQSRPPTISTSSTPRERRGVRKVSSGTTADTPLRRPGRCDISTT